MPYTKQTWQDTPAATSPINATRLAYIEEGIEAARILAEGVLPSGAIAQTILRSSTIIDSNLVSSGTLFMIGIILPAAVVVTSITFTAGATAGDLDSGTHAWAALYDSSRNLLRQSPDDTAPVWAANTAKTFTLSSTFTTTYSGLHYLGLMASATTLPYLFNSRSNVLLTGFAPVLSGTSTTGLLGTAPNPAAAITVVDRVPYAYVS